MSVAVAIDTGKWTSERFHARHTTWGSTERADGSSVREVVGNTPCGLERAAPTLRAERGDSTSLCCVQSNSAHLTAPPTQLLRDCPSIH
jgi:hypothetical protein